ncbi:MAG: alpha-glucosidase/alpha-galactosidase [Bacillota bacterium]|nr:MAG: alpha-glucosidase/alpha-galactosidase [Bacillota bacterium]
MKGSEKMKKIRIAYIGGGSRLWARGLMSDLACVDDFSGEVVLYDIDQEAAINNQKLGTIIMEHKDAKHQFCFSVANSLEEALINADFVFISILPGTFDEMEDYVHIPEKYGIFQPVGDTAGPAGIFRSLIMMPMFEKIATAIKHISPNAWVVNFTNPMTMCVQMLYHVFPEIKAFGNCHEVSHVQDLLKRALFEEMGIEAKKKDIHINPLGINHFTWINHATYKDIDLMPIYERFARKYQVTGTCGNHFEHLFPFGSGERVKFDLFLKHQMIAAAGDRHLVEFLPHNPYTLDKDSIAKWKFFLTPVSFRKEMKEKGNQSAINIIHGKEKIELTPTDEEGVTQLRALLGIQPLMTNVNIPNQGQIPNLPLGHVVETNAFFRFNDIRPIFAGPMSGYSLEITKIHIDIHRMLLESFDKRDLSIAKKALKLDPLSSHVSDFLLDDMFDEIIKKIRPFLHHYVLE